MTVASACRVDCAARGAAEQMRQDSEAAAVCASGMRFFIWSPPAVSLGWKQPVPEWLCSPAWQDSGLQWVERPTAGGAAFHGTDVSLSLVVPQSEQPSLRGLMARVCESAARLCRRFGIEAEACTDRPSAGRVTVCLSQPSPYAVLVAGRKVAGFGARRYPRAWLVQGSLLVNDLPAALAVALPESVRSELEARALPLAAAADRALSEENVAHAWAEQWETDAL